MKERYDILPDCFKKKIDEAHKNNPNFSTDPMGEVYFMYILEQSIVIALRCKTEEKVEEFKNMSNEEQHKLVPEFDDGHSGNTFGGAIAYAKWFLKQPEYKVYNREEKLKRILK